MKTKLIMLLVTAIIAFAITGLAVKPRIAHAQESYVPFYLVGAVNSDLDGACYLLFYASVKKGVTYQLEGSANCGQSYVDLDQFTATANTTYSYSYRIDGGGYLPRLEIVK